MNMEKRKTSIASDVLRFEAPDTYFGFQDRTVPVVLSENSAASDLKEYAVLIEEYVAEQLDYKVVDDLLVLNSNGGLKYDDEYGLRIPDHYHKPYSRSPDHIAVHPYELHLVWTGELNPGDYLCSLTD